MGGSHLDVPVLYGSVMCFVFFSTHGIQKTMYHPFSPKMVYISIFYTVRHLSACALGVTSENIPSLIFAFLLIAHLLQIGTNIVQRNSSLVTHGRERDSSNFFLFFLFFLAFSRTYNDDKNAEFRIECFTLTKYSQGPHKNNLQKEHATKATQKKKKEKTCIRSKRGNASIGLSFNK